MKKLFYCIMFLLSTSVLLFSCKKGGENEKGATGYIYTSTNSTEGNAIIAVARHQDGTLEELSQSPYKTGAYGDAAEGDFDHQWALRIVGDYLLAVNAGANPVNGSISVFRINKTNGKLSQVDQDPSTPVMDNIDSRGVRAVSITSKVINGTNWVLVGNQFANPNYIMDPPQPINFPVVTTPLRNVAVFSFNAAAGLLKFNAIGAEYMDGTNGGPATVDFNSTGTKVAVTTWGIAHCHTENPNLTLQRPGRLYVYDFSNGNMSQTGMFEEKGISGNIGLSWSPNDKYVYVANFNLHSTKEGNSITVHDGTTAVKIQNFGSADRNDEACWTWVSLNKKHLYAASFNHNFVSTYDIGSDGKLSVSLQPNFVKRRNVPDGDTKDMHEAGGYLYVSGSLMSHTISTFRRNESTGALSEMPSSPYHIPSAAGKTETQVAFLGLTGFDKTEQANTAEEKNK